LQILAEVHVILQLVRTPWPELNKISHEPVASGSRKNPELVVKFEDVEVGFEVKAPSLIDHVNRRSTNRTQLAGRVFGKEEIQRLPNADSGITYPRDNPIKDFLVSADEKFRAFKACNEQFYGVLVILWDDFIYEPISALLQESGGLFTDASFYVDENSAPVKFDSVNAVVVIRHLHQIMAASRDEEFTDNCQGTFDFGRDGEFPPRAFIANPYGTGVPEAVPKALQAYTPSSEMGAEYTPADLVWWI
jgi:hypothetical protein